MAYAGKLEEAVKSEGTMHSPIEQRLESTQELLQHVTKSLQDAISRQVALERYLGISIQKEDNYVIYEVKTTKEFPVKETLIPIAKRKIMLKNKPIFTNKKYIN